MASEDFYNDYGDEGPIPYTVYSATQNDDGTVFCHCETNDDKDDGSCSKYASWDLTFTDMATFLGHVHGGTGHGNGSERIVWLDGDRVFNNQIVRTRTTVVEERIDLL